MIHFLRSSLLAATLLLLSVANLFGQTTLSAGEVAILRINADNPDEFVFVLLADIAAGTTIQFTDQGWNANTNAFMSNGEGHLEWTAPVGGLLAGTVIEISDPGSGFTASEGTIAGVSGTFALAVAGDQVLVYQGTTGAPTMLFAATTHSLQWTNGNSTDTNRSGLPAGLTDGVNAVAAGSGNGAESEYDNIAFDLTTWTSGSAADLLALLADVNNWNGSDASRYTGTISNFNFTSFPVEWLSFQAESSPQGVSLQWATAQELNNDYFAIERSSDGRMFEAIGQVAGQGTSDQATAYTFVDARPLQGNSYYRIRQVDMDGQFDYSPTVQTTFRIEGLQVRAYPNPVVDRLEIQTEAPVGLRILDIAGRELLRGRQTAGLQSWNVSQLSAGCYFLELRDDQQQVQVITLRK